MRNHICMTCELKLHQHRKLCRMPAAQRRCSWTLVYTQGTARSACTYLPRPARMRCCFPPV